MSERQAIFANCGKVLLQIYNSSPNEEVADMIQQVSEARKCTLAIIGEIASACEEDINVVVSKQVESVLSDLHPKTVRYSVDGVQIGEKLIRDLAEICATLRSIELGVKRSNKEWFLEANIFCDHMADELSKTPA